LALVAIGDTHSLDQQECFPGVQTMLPAGIQDPFLITGRQGRQMGGNRRAQDPIGHRLGRPWGKFRGQIQPSDDPLPLAPQELGDRRCGEMVLREERLDHQPFAQRADGALGGVGLKQHALVIRRPTASLDDHWNLLAARQAPPRQTLEPVDHLEPAIAGGHDAERQIAQLLRPTGHDAGPEPFIRAAQTFERNAQNLAPTGIKCGRGRIRDRLDEHGGPSWVPSYEGGGGWGG